jgi:hypothetical protein
MAATGRLPPPPPVADLNYNGGFALLADLEALLRIYFEIYCVKIVDNVFVKLLVGSRNCIMVTDSLY